jgi:ADP-heptose:LPS heptosyltransferase
LTKLLVIRFSSIGDIVLTSPVVRALKQQMDNVEIHFLTKKAYEPLVMYNPNIDRVITIEKSIGEVLSLLKEEDYDRIIDLHKNFRSMGVKLKLRKRSHSFPKLNFRKWLLVRFKINRMPSIHIVDRYFEAVRPLGVRNDKKGLDYFTEDNNIIGVDAILPGAENGYIAFVIGAKHYTKMLPYEKIIEICGRIDYPVLLLGGTEDRDRGTEIMARSGGKVGNCCGSFDIHGSARLIRQADLVITHDTGLMHIAAAYRKKIISLWGNTVPEFGMYPYMPEGKGVSEIIEVKGLSCRPCSKIGFRDCPKSHFRCMVEIDVDAVVAKIREFLP